jgi:hypothetical protein
MNKTLRRAIPPAVSIAMLVTMVATNAAGTLRRLPEVTAYFARVKAGIEDVPLQAGPWLGMDIDVIPAAQELLQPNKILQRRYTNADTGEWFEMLIVHCGDVRDMLGHYPPVCYKANGWSLENKESLSVPVGAFNAPATRYVFEREIDFVKDEIRIVNVFALPAPAGEGFGEDLAIVQRAGRYRERARMGSAQVQVIVPAWLTSERQDEIIGTAMSLVGPVLLDVERGPM